MAHRIQEISNNTEVELIWLQKWQYSSLALDVALGLGCIRSLPSADEDDHLEALLLLFFFYFKQYILVTQYTASYLFQVSKEQRES